METFLTVFGICVFFYCFVWVGETIQKRTRSVLFGRVWFAIGLIIALCAGLILKLIEILIWG